MPLEILTRHPQQAAKSHPLLFVHGGWHGAWCWDDFFLPWFAERGYQSYAVSLSAHGNTPKTKPMVLHGVWDYVADVATAADQIEAETGKRPIIIGHSMGGYVVQKYLERHAAPAAVLLTTIPAVGTLPLQFRLMRDHPIDFLKTVLTLDGWPFVSTPEKAHALFFSETMPTETVLRHQARMSSESLRILLDGGILNQPNPKKVPKLPMLVLSATEDRVFTVSEGERTAEAYRADFHLQPGCAHDVMLERAWEQVAGFVGAWLDAV